MTPKFLIMLSCVLMVNVASAESKLTPCPDKPNCVSSLDTENESHHVAAFPIILDINTSFKVLKGIIADMPRTKLVKDQQDYLAFTFTSLIFRFVDDVEFEFDPQKQQIEVKSASRVGYSDLGVNRKRVKIIRTRYMEKRKDFKVAVLDIK